MYQVKVDKNSDGQRADKFIKKILPLAPTNFIYKMFRKKDIKLNGVKIDEKTMVHENDILEMFLYEDKVKAFQNEVTIEKLDWHFQVIYEDDNILIVNKPCGLILHEDENEKKNTLVNQVLSYLYQKGEYDPKNNQGFIPGPVHRLDRNTSGCVIFGKTFAALKDLNEMVRLRHCIEKKYLTIVSGCFKKQHDHLIGYMRKDEKKQQCYIVSKNAPGALTMETEYNVLKQSSEYALIEVRLITGRTHQIRLHMASIGHPVIGDRKYGDFSVNKIVKEKYGLQHQLLHAYQLTFTKCIGSLKYLEGKSFQAPLNKQFTEIKQDLF